MNPLQKLTSLFTQFPGIGTRQAGRLAFFLMQSKPHVIDEMIHTLQSLKGSMAQCTRCYRYFEKAHTQMPICDLCRTPAKVATTLMVVARDIDLENMRHSNIYHGYYFVLGGLIPLLEKNHHTKIRTSELIHEVRRRHHEDDLKEIIIALNATPEGDHTAFHLQRLLAPLAQEKDITITTLGRGLSTGTELEYSDTETLKSALENRK